MSVLKVYKNKKWEVLYADEIALRLKKTANLSDIPDKKAARTNLEIEGDNITTHNHNSIYLPLIQESKDLSNQVLKALDSVKREKLNATDAISQFLSKSAGGDLLNKIGDLESSKMTKNQVQDLITTAVNALTTNNIKGLNELITKITNESANTGVRMNLSQNGYICFGSKFGNLTLQWIYTRIYRRKNQVVLSLKMKNFIGVLTSDNGNIDKSFQDRNMAPNITGGNAENDKLNLYQIDGKYTGVFALILCMI